MIKVLPVTSTRWEDLVFLFERLGPRGGAPVTSHCWCQYWHVRGAAYRDTPGATHRARLEERVHGGDEPGLLAYLDGEPVGWCRVGPCGTFERLEHSTKLTRADDEDVWSVVCFYVHPTAKRRGVASVLLAAAVDHAAARGARVIEGYPVRPGHPNIDAHTGYLPMFLAAGFEHARGAGRRSVVRRPLR